MKDAVLKALQVLTGIVMSVLALAVTALIVFALWPILLVLAAYVVGMAVIAGILWIGFGTMAYAVQEIRKYLGK